MTLALDLDAFAAACEAGHSADLEKWSEQAGFTFAAADAARLASVQHGSVRVQDMLVAALDALHDESGVGLVEVVNTSRGYVTGRHYVLAVRHQGALAVACGAVTNLPMTLGDAWPALKPWFKDFRKNRRRLEAWLATPDPTVLARLPVRAAATGAGDAQLEVLRAAVHQRPDDDPLRLVLADHLLERGDVRGELMRLGVERASVARHDPRWAELTAKHDALVAAHGTRLAGEVARHATDFTFDRGFVGEVTMTASAFRAHGDRLFTHEPIHSLVLRPINGELVAKLATAGGLARVRRLVLGNPDIYRMKQVAYAALAKAPPLERLETLELDHTVSTPNDWAALFEGLRAPALRTVSFAHSVVSPRILTALANNPSIRALACLRFDSAGDGARFNYVFPGRKVPKSMQPDPKAALDGFTRLGAAPGFAAVAELDLHGWFVGEAPLLAWAKGPNLRFLKRLHLGNTGCTPKVLARLGARADLALEALTLDADEPISVCGFLKSPGARTLKSLHAYARNGLDSELVVRAALALPAEHPLKQLRVYPAVSAGLKAEAAARFPD